MSLGLLPGRSVRPHSPTKRVSPVSSLPSVRRQMPSGVCPGVWMTLIVMVPKRMVSPSTTLMSWFTCESLWAIILEWKADLSSSFPAVWSV